MARVNRVSSLNVSGLWIFSNDNTRYIKNFGGAKNMQNIIGHLEYTIPEGPQISTCTADVLIHATVTLTQMNIIIENI